MRHNLYGEKPANYRGICFHPSIVGWAAIWKFLRAHSEELAQKKDLSRGDVQNIMIGVDSMEIIRRLIKDFNENPLKYEMWRQDFMNDILIEVDGKPVDPFFDWDWFEEFEQFINNCERIHFNPEDKK